MVLVGRIKHFVFSSRDSMHSATIILLPIPSVRPSVRHVVVTGASKGPIWPRLLPVCQWDFPSVNAGDNPPGD